MDVLINQLLKISHHRINQSYPFSFKEVIMGFKRRFFGDSYLERRSVLKHLYYRIIFLRGWFIDFPVLIGVCYLIPWEILYGADLMQNIVLMMEEFIPNIQKHRAHSDFPSYAVSYLSVIHILGFICLLFPLVYAKPTREMNKYLIKSGNNPLKLIVIGFTGTLIFIIPPLCTGAVTFFGCYECSYHNKISLVAGAIVPWALANFGLVFTLMVVKNYLKNK